MFYTRLRLPLALALFVVLLAGSFAIFRMAQAAPAAPTAPAIHNNGYSLLAWPVPAEGPFAYMTYSDGPRDSTGVRMYLLNGVLYNHPVIQAQDGLFALQRYAVQGSADAADLTLAEKEGARLLSYRVGNANTGIAWWYPYPFNFAEYGDPKLTAKTPWYSGMAQGEAMDLFTRLFQVTGDPQWSSAAWHTFYSFLYPLLPSETDLSRPWCVITDSNVYIWSEEYPTPNKADDTVNGLGFALFGLIDYYKAFSTPLAKTLADELLTTFLYATGVARHPGGVSSYSLSHLSDRPADYHVLVTQILWDFTILTGNTAYRTMEADYWEDYHLAVGTKALPNPTWQG